MPPRTAAERRADTVQALRASRDVWVASADETGAAHLIPLSFLWDGACLILATPEASKTTRNLRRAGWARVALPSPDDVVIIEGPVEMFSGETEAALADAHTAATGFDARAEREPYVYIRLTPSLVQAWRDAAELRGRTIMRDGRWRHD